MQFTISNDDYSFELNLEDIENLDIISTDKNGWHVIHNFNGYNFSLLKLDRNSKTLRLKLDNEEYNFKIQDQLDMLIDKMGMKDALQSAQNDLKAPMPGLILELLVKPGDKVEKDDNLVILEAMKMENLLKAEGEGIVKSVMVKKGDSVEKHQVLLELE
jgi:biotin carboxyl carrier protein